MTLILVIYILITLIFFMKGVFEEYASSESTNGFIILFALITASLWPIFVLIAGFNRFWTLFES